MVALNEKLLAKEVPSGEALREEKAEPLVMELAHMSTLPLNVKLEDRLSSGSGESAVVDEDAPQLVVDSVDSYFSAENFDGCMTRSEDDDGSDDGRSYFSDVFVAPQLEHQNHEEGEALYWWAWS